MFLKLIGKTLRFLFWIAIILSIIITLIFFFGAKHVGVLEAKYDLWRGRYELHGYGLIYGVPSNVEILNVHGIKYRHVAGCVVNDFIIDSVANYNLVMKTAIKKDLDYDIDNSWIWPYTKTANGEYIKQFRYE
jgi:hypothetical protein